MTLQEARVLLFQNENLIGVKYQKYTIDELVIVPSSREGFDDIIKQALWGESYEHLLYGYEDFIILALLDFKEYPNSGFLFTENLTRILES